VKASKPIQRRLLRALESLDRGNTDEACGAIMELMDDVVDGKQVGKLFATRPMSGWRAEPRPKGTAAKKAAGEQPKPRTRIEDPGLIIRYRLSHPCCEAGGEDCLYGDRWPDSGLPKPEVHHIIPKSKGGEGGDDVEHNLVSLCLAHHTGRVGWHILKPDRWFERFHLRLSPEAIAKIHQAGVLKKWPKDEPK